MDSLPKITKEKILQNTINSTEFCDVAEPHKVLPKLCVRVYPQLEEVDFYGGHCIPEHDYVPASSRARIALRKQRDSESIRERCELGNLLHRFKQGQLTFTGQAGSGKSTLLKAIAREVIDGKYEGLKDVEIVHHIQCHNFRRGDKITLGELLFQNMNPKLSDEEIMQTLEYAATNPNRFLFILDSLDTLSYTIDGVYEQLCVTDRASPEAVLWNFLAGKLIPGCRIITSSREHSIRNYNGEVRAQKVIALVGLSMDSIRKIIVGYVGEKEAEEIMQYMEHKSPTLIDLSATPVFLTYNLVGFKYGSDFKASTMSGILILLLNSLIRSPHAHEEHILEVINKLQELSFTGTKERRVLFSTEEFARFGLDSKAVTDLAILAPGGLTQRILLGSDLMFFAHQSIQELLTAMYIAQMPREPFLDFLEESIHTAHYAVVRRILCGLLLDSEVKDQAEQYFQGNLNMKENEDLLRQSLRDQLSQDMDEADKLELYLSLSEAKNGMKEAISSSVEEINMDEIPLSPSDAHAVGWVASNCKQLSELWLMDCHLTSASVNALVLNLRDCDLKMSTLVLHQNTNMGVAGLKSVGEISKQSKMEKLFLGSCNLSPQQLQALKDGLDSAKLSTLDLQDNTAMGEEGLTTVGEISKQCRVEKLDLRYCELSSKELQVLKEGLDSAKLSSLNLQANTAMGEEGLKTVCEISKQCRVEKLDLGYCELSSKELQVLKEGLDSAKLSTLNLVENNAMGEEGLKTVGEISKQCRVNGLDLQGCKLSPQELQALKDGLDSAKLSTLDLQANTKMGEEGFKTVGDISKQCGVEELKLANCRLSLQELQALKQGLDSAKLSTLHLQGNTAMGEEGLKTVGEISKQCRVEKLHLGYCRLSSKELQVLKEGLDSAKLSTLNLRANRKMGEEGLKTVGEISKQCGVEELELNVCELSSQELQALKEGLDSAKIQKLYLESFSDVNKTASHEDILAVSELIPNITELLDLTYWEINEEDADYLQQQLDRCSPTELTITYGFGTTLYQSRQMKPKQTEVTDEEGGKEDGVQETWSGTVTPQGADLRLGGCVISFPEYAFDHVTKVAAKVEIDSTKWPPGYIGVTPMLYMESDRVLQNPVSVCMTSWCMNDRSKESKKIELDILHLPNQSTEWEVIGKHALKDETIIQFHTLDFSPFIVALKEKLFGPQVFLIDGYLFADDANSFNLMFFLKNDLLDNKLIERAERHNYRMKIQFTTIRAKRSESLKIVTISETDGFHIKPEGGHSYAVNESFIKKELVVTFNSLVSCPLDCDSGGVEVKCDVLKNNEIIDGPRYFGFTWKRKTKEHATSVVQHHHDYRKVTANTVISDRSTATISSRNNHETVTALNTGSPMVHGRNQYAWNFVFAVLGAILGILLYLMLNISGQ